jgi:DNA helicase-2/ATP-dependent DNA helicase PcrA
MRFYDRKEIKNALAFARLIVNPRDEASARRVINEPKRGIGDAAQAKLGVRRAERTLLRRVDRTTPRRLVFHGKALSGAQKFSFMLDELRALARTTSRRVRVIDAIVRESGMGDALRAENTDEAYSRLENLGELASAASQYDTLMDFVERMALVADSDQLDGGAGAISMMTLHVAKGFEYPRRGDHRARRNDLPASPRTLGRRRTRRGTSPLLRGITRAMRSLECSRTRGVGPCGATGWTRWRAVSSQRSLRS